MWLQLRILIMTQIYKIKQNGIFAGNFGVGQGSPTFLR